MPDIYAVFEGGGVKGIGHVGALAEIGWSEPSLTIKGYAGASAGAIVAALAAAGYPAAGPNRDAPAGPDSMKAILEQLDLAQLLDGIDEVPLTTIQGLTSRLGTIVEDLAERSRDVMRSHYWTGGKPAKWNLLGRRLSQLWSKNADIVAAFRQLWEHKGVYGTVKFRNWIDGLLRKKSHLLDTNGNVTFKSLERGTKGTILKVVVTDIAGRVAKTYGPSLTPSDQVADAVLASMTIPLFFRPFPFGPNNYYVDGGLLSNFPAWLFDDENVQRKESGDAVLPLLGIRLVAPRPTEPPNITSTKEFLSGLLATKLDGADFLQTRSIERFVGINVELPLGLNAWDFNLDSTTKTSLFNRGTVAARTALFESPNRETLGL